MDLIRLKELKEGNIFSYYPNVGGSAEYAIKIKGISVPEICPIIPIDTYFPMALDADVYQVSKAENYDSGIGFKSSPEEPKKLKDVEGGWICWTGHPFGLIQYILVTDVISFTGKVVASLKSPSAIDCDEEVYDHGYAGDYSESPKEEGERRLRLCPNCGEYTLAETDEDPGTYDVIGRCDNCFIKVALCWNCK